MTYSGLLKGKADRFAHDVYRATRDFPQHETYGVTSQMRRASLSVVLNCVEGFARGGNSFRQFCRISYGSLQETKYLIGFCREEGLLDDGTHDSLIRQADEIGAMLWGIMKPVRTDID